MEEFSLPGIEQLNLVRVREVVRRVILRLRIEDDRPRESLALQGDGAQDCTIGKENAAPAWGAGAANADPFGETDTARDS